MAGSPPFYDLLPGHSLRAPFPSGGSKANAARQDHAGSGRWKPVGGRERIQVDRSLRFELVSAEPRVIREHAAALIRTSFQNLVAGRIPGGWACSSAGQSARLISVRSEVQVFPGPPRSEPSLRPTPDGLRLRRWSGASATATRGN